MMAAIKRVCLHEYRIQNHKALTGLDWLQAKPEIAELAKLVRSLGQND